MRVGLGFFFFRDVHWMLADRLIRLGAHCEHQGIIWAAEVVTVLEAALCPTMTLGFVTGTLTTDTAAKGMHNVEALPRIAALMEALHKWRGAAAATDVTTENARRDQQAAAQAGGVASEAGDKYDKTYTDCRQVLESEKAIVPGCRVRLHGLKSEAGRRLNGKEGIVEGFDAEKHRWAVCVDGKTSTFKSKSLEVVIGNMDTDMIQLHKMMTAEVMKMTPDKAEKKLIQLQRSGGHSADIEKAVHAHRLARLMEQMELGHFAELKAQMDQSKVLDEGVRQLQIAQEGMPDDVWTHDFSPAYTSSIPKCGDTWMISWFANGNFAPSGEEIIDVSVCVCDTGSPFYGTSVFAHGLPKPVGMRPSAADGMRALDVAMAYPGMKNDHSFLEDCRGQSPKRRPECVLFANRWGQQNFEEMRQQLLLRGITRVELQSCDSAEMGAVKFGADPDGLNFKSDRRGTTCACCAKVATVNKQFSQCAACKTVHYCSRECQKSHWKSGHKAACKNNCLQRKT